MRNIIIWELVGIVYTRLSQENLPLLSWKKLDPAHYCCTCLAISRLVQIIWTVFFVIFFNFCYLYWYIPFFIIHQRFSFYSLFKKESN